MNKNIIQTQWNAAFWHALKQSELIKKLPPCAVDKIIRYKGDLSFEEYLHSLELLDEVKIRLKKYSCYAAHGVDVSLLDDLTSTDLLPYFAWGLVGRLKKELDVAYIPFFTDREAHALFLKHILRKIPQFDPGQGGWEAYLQRTAFRDGKKVIIKEILRHEKMDFHKMGVWDAALLPSDARVISRSIRNALRVVLADEVDRRLFEEAVYSGKKFEEIAAEIGSNKSTISRVLNNIREQLAHALEAKFGDFGRRMEFQRFEVFARVFRECLPREEFRKIY